MAMLVEPDLLNRPYRLLAEAGDVAAGTVMACLKHLRTNRFFAVQGADRRVRAVPDLIALWVGAYVEILRPRLGQRRFQVPTAAKPEMWDRLRVMLAARHVPWALTGADAAEITAGHFRAEDTEIYAPLRWFEERKLLMDLRAQPAARGNLVVIEPPSPAALRTDGKPLPLAPLLLQYAELSYRGTDQAREAAGLLLPKLLVYLDDELIRVIGPVLNTVCGDAATLGLVAHELGWPAADDDALLRLSEPFRWFRSGLGSIRT
jgi:hypothetical protein